MSQAWQVRTGDGRVRFYADKAEAEFAFREADERGMSAEFYPIPIPTTAKHFADFLTDFWDRARERSER